MSTYSHYVSFLSAFNSFQSGALYFNDRKANLQQLVPFLAKAQQQVKKDCVEAIKNKQPSFALRSVEKLMHLEEIASELCLQKDVAFYIAEKTNYKK